MKNKLFKTCPVKLAKTLSSGGIMNELDKSYMLISEFIGMQEVNTMKWAPANQEECDWLVDYFASLCAEFTLRHNKVHRYEFFIGYFDIKLCDIFKGGSQCLN